MAVSIGAGNSWPAKMPEYRRQPKAHPDPGIITCSYAPPMVIILISGVSHRDLGRRSEGREHVKNLVEISSGGSSMCFHS